MGTHKRAEAMVEPATEAIDVAGAERRRAQRLLVDLEVDYQCEDNYLFAYISDISSTGIFVRTTTPHPPGTRLNLRFAPPAPSPAVRRRAVSAPLVAVPLDEDEQDDHDDDWPASNTNTPAHRPSGVILDLSPIEVEGEVIWTNAFRPDDVNNTHPGMGIRFSPLDDQTRQRLLDLIRRIAYLPEL
jgi:PilZ domain